MVVFNVQKLEIVGDARALKKGIQTLNGIDCRLKAVKDLEIVPVNVNGEDGYVVIGDHSITIKETISPSMEFSLILGINGTLMKISEPRGPASKESHVHVVNAFRRYMMNQMKNEKFAPKGVIMGVSRNGTQASELWHIVD